MNFLYLIIFFVVGTLFGSFFTVVGSRLPNNEDFIRGRSHCDNCKHELSFLDMIPIISYIILHGRCRYCKKKISSLSSYMEFFTGALFSLSYYIFGLSYELFISLGIVALLIIISVSDISYFIIPDQVLIFFSGYFIIINCLNNGILYALFSILSGFIMFSVMYLIMLLGNFLFKKESLGGGDIKLMFVAGLVLHPFLCLFVIFFASLLALPISLIILKKKHINLVPFGPFLLISFMFVYFTKIDIIMLINFIKNI